MICNVAVIFGGRSCEHEISILSALQVMHALKESYHIIPIYISKQGELYSGEEYMDLSSFKKMGTLLKKKDKVHLYRENESVYVEKNWFKREEIDFVIPVMHGTNGEDGAIQGYLEILHVPYSGSNIVASAMAQSKIITKQWLTMHQFPVLPYQIITSINEDVSFLPCIIKPDHLGSSIGIGVVEKENIWQKSISEALLYDERCIVEPYIADFKEINCAVMYLKGEIICSHLEEVKKYSDILSFKDKYEGGKEKCGNARILDPDISLECRKKIKEIAKQIYECFRFSGVIRIDFMVVDEAVYVNEINTIPGSYAFYLWEEKNLKQLLEECMEEGMKNYQKKNYLITSFDSSVLFQYKGGKVK